MGRTTSTSRTTKNGQPPALPRLLDIPAIAEHLGVNVRHVRRLVAERRIPFLKWGHLIRFDPAAIAAWLEESQVELEDQPRRGRPRHEEATDGVAAEIARLVAGHLHHDGRAPADAVEQ